jgi:hypothetical protein
MTRIGWMALLMLMTATVASRFTKPTPKPEFFNCKIVQCAAPDCLDNEHLEVPPGQCCPVCVPN